MPRNESEAIIARVYGLSKRGGDETKVLTQCIGQDFYKFFFAKKPV